MGIGWIILAWISMNFLFNATPSDTHNAIQKQQSMQYKAPSNNNKFIMSNKPKLDHTFDEIIDENYYTKQQLKIFIDLGANVGDTLELFYHTRYLHSLQDSKEFIAFAFEPNDMNQNDLNQFVTKHPSMKTYIIQKGASIRDGKILFWPDDKNNGIGSKIVNESNLIEAGKLCGFTRRNCQEIVTIDIIKWMNNICPDEHDDEHCYIALKIDIEGNEYEILKQMIIKGNLCIIDELHIEWHDVKKRTKERQYIISELKKCGLTLKYVTFPIDEVSMDILGGGGFTWNDMIFFDKFEDCKWNNTKTGKMIPVTWCDEHYYKILI